MRPIRAILIIVAALAVVVPSAHAAGFDTIFKDFKADGQINPCKYSAAELQKAKKQVPPDIEQYAPDFPDALQAAIEARAKGQCDKKAAAVVPAAASTPAATPPAAAPPAAGAAAPAAATTAAAPAQPPAPTPAAGAPAGAPTDSAIVNAAKTSGNGGGGSTPAPLVGLAALLAMALVAGLLWALARFGPWEPTWALRLRHATGEAGWRAGATWADFTDWLRLGRSSSR